MYHLPLTLETPAANLALDEALLETAEARALPGEVLRLWEPVAPLVVLGRSSPLAEVQLDACRRDGVAVLRRASGGGAVVGGPGCLMYAVVLELERRPELRAVDRAHQFVLRTLAAQLGRFAAGIALAGTSDLALTADDGAGLRKFAGSSLRIRRDHLLYHGAILYDFPLERLDQWLGPPTRQPDYRGNRSHGAFVANLPASRVELSAALIEAWDAREPLAVWPQARTAELAATRYATVDWNVSSRGAGDL